MSGGGFDSGIQLLVWVEPIFLSTAEGYQCGGGGDCGNGNSSLFTAAIRDEKGVLLLTETYRIERNVQRIQVGSKDLPVPTGLASD